jgi:carboxyl-terminal processing protease
VYGVEGGGLKLTIARWFTPAGRSITREHRPNISADSLKKLEERAPKFRTDGGREVNGNGGIRPDIIVADSAASVASLTLSRALGAKVNDFRDVLTAYAMSFRSTGSITRQDFTVTPQMRAELYRRLAERKVVIDSGTARTVGPLVDRMLSLQIARYVFGTDVEFRRQLDTDPVVKRAVQVLTKASTPKDVLAAAK